MDLGFVRSVLHLWAWKGGPESNRSKRLCALETWPPFCTFSLLCNFPQCLSLAPRLRGCPYRVHTAGVALGGAEAMGHVPDLKALRQGRQKSLAENRP